MLHIICTNDLPFSFSYFRRLFFLSWFHYFCLIFRARILFPYLYLNFHSCTRSIVCRFWWFFRCEFLLFAESSLFFFFFSVYVIFICIQKKFNDIFFVVLLFLRFNFLCSFFILFFNYSIYLSFFFSFSLFLSTAFLLTVNMEESSENYILRSFPFSMFKFVHGTSFSLFKLFHLVHCYFVSNTVKNVILLANFSWNLSLASRTNSTFSFIISLFFQ